MRLNKTLVLVFLLALTATAAAETNKCTDAQGKITYINAPCETGQKTQRVNDDNISIIDASTDRARIAAEKAKANTPTDNPDIPTPPPAANDPNLAKLKEAQTLIQTAMAARNYMGFSAATFLIVAAAFMLVRRSRKTRPSAISHEIAPLPKIVNQPAPQIVPPPNNSTPPPPPES